MNLGGPEMLVIGAVLVFLAIPVFALISVVLHTREDFEAIDQSRATWIVLLLVGIALTLLGLVLGCYYFLAVRPKLVRGTVA